MSLVNVSRWVRGFDPSGELKVEYRLPESWTLDRLRRLFNVVEENPMFDSFPVGPLQATELGGDLGKDLTGSELHFFLEADAEGYVC
jgi:hypothetical protein